jgi:hypothetical protein
MPAYDAFKINARKIGVLVLCPKQTTPRWKRFFHPCFTAVHNEDSLNNSARAERT